jgi:phosphatidylserine/phosphatidylglycerophosphate/cardiolipin synthase-like enzyme
MFNGWLDAHLRIKGPAALDVGNNFVARWNSKTKPTQDKLDSLIRYKNPAYAPVPALTGNGAPPLQISTSGSNSVQITRTFSCKYKGYSEFAPKGERSLFLARLKAIRQAKHFIYIEDQYFIEVPELLQALLEVLPRLQRVIKENMLTGYPKYLFDMIAPLQQKFPNKFQVYSTKRERKLYIHSKVVLIDDVYVSIGSANWNRRSMTSDSEMSVNVVDTQHQVTADGLLVAKTARDFRVRKFSELTGKSYAEIDALKFIDAANTLGVATKDPTAILDWLEVTENAAHAAVTDLLHDLVDPDDTC